MTSCEQLSTVVSGFSLIEHCDIVKDGTLRLATPFLYQDGSKIDLFLSEPGQAHLVNFILSDKGNTSAYLLDLNVKHWSTKRRKLAVEDICNALGVAMNGGQLEVHLSPAQMIGALPDAIVRLAQASIRVSDLALTQRLRAVNSFKEEVEEFFDSKHLGYETSIAIRGRFGKDVPIDFRVKGQRRSSLVQTVSTANPTAGHGMTNEAFSRWFDIEDLRDAYQEFVTIYDSTTDAFREEDILRLSTRSVVLGYPAESDSIADVLAA
jgi:hypothetical protein